MSAQPAIADSLTILSKDEPANYRWHGQERVSRVLVLCDHASANIPLSLNNLGVSEAERARHIGYDIGAAAVAEIVADALQAPCIFTNYSRLVLDVNRELDDPSSIPPVSDHTPIAGNQNLSAAQKEQRAQELFYPYHQQIKQHLLAIRDRGEVPVIISMHSFTPIMNDFVRPWHVGLLWDNDPRMAVPIMQKLAAIDGVVVGDNEPYSGRLHKGYTMEHHVIGLGLPGCLLEIRQDLIADAAGQKKWADILIPVLRECLEEDGMNEVRIYG
ncbi:MAG: N-formylglutamate amidohydrolase [Alphaproteobacteria bacterium]